jgi:hypothetical protein
MANNYEDDLKINMLSLHTEWNEQPRLFMKYSMLLADKRDELSRAEQSADVERAEADKRARARHAGDEKKPTEGVINSEVLTDSGYKQKADKLLNVKHEVDILQAAVRAFDQRKDALENLVRLHGQQYFAGPQVPYEIGKEFVQQAEARGHEQARDKTVERMGGSERPARSGRST